MIWVTGFILGLCLGSLTKVIADRSLINRSFWGRSYCENCKKQLHWYDLFPLFSYLFSGGKCRYCKTKLSLEYPLVEFLMGVLVAGLFARFIPADFLSLNLIQGLILGTNLIFYCVVLITLVAVFLTDFKTGYIPDRITFPATWMLFVLLFIISGIKIYDLYNGLKGSAIGKYLLPPYSNYFYDNSLRLAEPLFFGALMALILGLFFYALIFFTRGKGMGGGDLKLGVFLGLAFGFPYSLVALMLSFLLGSVFGIAMILMKKKKFGQTIPFGPFLSLAGLLVLFWGDKILAWYLTLKIN